MIQQCLLLLTLSVKIILLSNTTYSLYPPNMLFKRFTVCFFKCALKVARKDPLLATQYFAFICFALVYVLHGSAQIPMAFDSSFYLLTLKMNRI